MSTRADIGSALRDKRLRAQIKCVNDYGTSDLADSIDVGTSVSARRTERPCDGKCEAARSLYGQLRTRDLGRQIADNAAAEDVEIKDMDKNREFLLPFGIDLRVGNGIASIESHLPEALPSFSDPVENGRIVGVIEGIEQLLLSFARVGIDLSNPQFAQAIHDCVANLQSG